MSDLDNFKSVRKGPRKTPEAKPDLELAAILKRRKLAEESVVKVEKEAAKLDEELLIKSAFSQADLEINKHLKQAAEEDDRDATELELQDCRPPSGCFETPPPPALPALAQCPVGVSDLPIGLLLKDSFKKDSISGKKMEGPEVYLLFREAFLAKDESTSAKSANFLDMLLTGTPLRIFEAAALLIPSTTSKNYLVETDWRFNSAYFGHLVLQSLGRDAFPPGNLRHLCRLLEVMAKSDLMDDPAQALRWLAVLLCCPCSEGYEDIMARCIGLCSIHSSSVGETEAAGRFAAAVCVGRIEGLTGTWEDDVAIHRARRLSTAFMSSHPLLGSFLDQVLFTEGVLRKLAQGKDSPEEPSCELSAVDAAKHFQLIEGEWDGCDSRARLLASYLVKDIADTQLVRRRLPSAPLNRWESAARVLELIGSLKGVTRATQSVVFKCAVRVLRLTSKTYSQAYTSFIDYMRLIKRTFESQKLDDKLGQTDIRRFAPKVG